MANISGAHFKIGSNRGHVENETPQVDINLANFQISKYEITQHQYFSIMNDSPGNFSCEDCPVEQVSWLDAVKFCNELSHFENIAAAYDMSSDTVVWDKSANGYRLPSEAEWEYACKAGTDTDFFTGNLDDINGNLLDPNLDQAGWYLENSGDRTHPVAQKQSNPFGLFDMHGNVWEWCWDYYNHDRYSFMDNPADDPVDLKYSTQRVIRGGSFFNDAFNARSTIRYFAEEKSSNLAIGFRVVRNTD